MNANDICCCIKILIKFIKDWVFTKLKKNHLVKFHNYPNYCTFTNYYFQNMMNNIENISLN